MSDNYNEAPEGLVEIPLEKWRRGMFHYCIGEPSQRQVRRPQIFDLMLFPLDYPSAREMQLGYAIKHEWYDNLRGGNRPEEYHTIEFCRYGAESDWNEFESKFAAQFAGDNS